MTIRAIVPLLGVLGLSVSPGCGVFKSSTTQASVESSSKSSSSAFEASSSPFRWSSDSSSPAQQAASAYHRDVRDFAARFAVSEGDLESFQRDLAAIAEGYGVIDWEHDQGTFFAVGRGIAQAQVGASRYREIALGVTHEDPARLALLEEGYETYSTR
jgi:hypothetical protein